ncbi:hypothetical protein, partial [Paenibacillus sp. SAF-068]
AVEIKPDKHDAYHNWGIDLGDLAGRKEGEEADALYQQAFDKYQKAVEIKPDKPTVYKNWGIDLENLSKRKVGEEADRLYQRALQLQAR